MNCPRGYGCRLEPERHGWIVEIAQMIPRSRLHVGIANTKVRVGEPAMHRANQINGIVVDLDDIPGAVDVVGAGAGHVPDRDLVPIEPQLCRAGIGKVSRTVLVNDPDKTGSVGTIGDSQHIKPALVVEYATVYRHRALAVDTAHRGQAALHEYGRT